MAKRSFGRLLVESCVNRALRTIAQDPERGLRNLVDLGRNFCRDGFSLRFMEAVQTLLAQEDSAYYDLLKQTMSDVDHERLKVFGINLGYNACTQGARTIRSNESALGFHIPFALTMTLSDRSRGFSPEQLQLLVEQGRELGIFLYNIFLSGEALPPELCAVFGQFDDCVFLLMGEPELFSPENLDALGEYYNLMLSVSLSDDRALSVTEELRQRKLLYSVHKSLEQQDTPHILSGDFFEYAVEARAVCVLLFCYDFYATEAHEQIRQYVDSVRRTQKHPFLLMEPATDLSTVDRMISETAYPVSFASNGQMVLAGRKRFAPASARFPDVNLRELLRYHLPPPSCI